MVLEYLPTFTQQLPRSVDKSSDTWSIWDIFSHSIKPQQKQHGAFPLPRGKSPGHMTSQPSLGPSWRTLERGSTLLVGGLEHFLFSHILGF